MTKKDTNVAITAIVLLGVVIGILIWRDVISVGDALQIVILFFLALATLGYVKRTKDMAEEMREQRYDAVRPAIDFKRDIANTDTVRQTSEVYAAIHEEAFHGLSCILCNVGLGPAIDVRSFIHHPQRGRLPFEFGTIESCGKTDRWILSISHESNHAALVACYEDIYGRTLKSSREVSIDKENHDWKLGRLKVVVVEEGDKE